MAGRSPNGDPPAIDRFVDIGRRSAGALLGIGRSPSGGRQTEPGKTGHLQLSSADTVRVPDGDRQAIADPVITALQGHENRPAIYRCAKIEIRQKSAKNPQITARFIELVTSALAVDQETMC